MKIILHLILIIFYNQAKAETASQISVEELGELPIEELSNIKITSIATGTEKTLTDAPSVTSIITANEIEAMGATNLEEALESVPGLHISRSDVYSYKYQIRGISTKFDSQVLVMINGIPITNTLTNSRNYKLGVLPIKMISKIEVIRGPGSAVYGANAISGVINVITKSSSDILGTEVGTRLGSFHTYEGWFLHGEHFDELDTTLMATFQETQGQKGVITEDAQTQLDKIFGTHASLAPGSISMSERRLAVFVSAEKNHLKLRGSFHDLGNVGQGQGIAGALDPTARYGFTRTAIDLTYHDAKWTPVWDITSQLAYLHASQEIETQVKLFPNGANLGNGVFTNGVSGNPEFWDRQIRFENWGIFTGIDKHRIRTGAGYYLADLYKVQESRNFNPTDYSPLPDLTNVSNTSNSFIPTPTRSNYHAYAQDEWQFIEDWEFTGGLRYDHYSDIGGTTNPRAALVWKTSSDLTTKFLFGQAFRAPSFAELYTKNNPVALGNSNLKPETIGVYELVFNYQVNPSWSSNLNLFHYKASNIITFVKDASGLSATAQNFGTQIGNGLEVETSYKSSPFFSITGNYSYVKATDKKSSKAAGEYPIHKVYVRDEWTFSKNWKWGNQVEWIGKRERIPTDNRAPLGGYTTVSTMIENKNVFKNCDIMISLRNIFDTDVREPSLGPGPTSTSSSIPHDLPEAGRNMNVALNYHF